MKVRKGFVSNSSSSSFICEISGETFEGRDASLSDFNLVECANGHTFCDEFLLADFEEFKSLFEGEPPTFDEVNVFVKDEKLSQELINNYKEYGEIDDDIENGYGIPVSFCPICQMEKFSKSELISYLMTKCDTDINKLSVEVKAKFNNYKEFQEYLK
jgi:hypothetical protein